MSSALHRTTLKLVTSVNTPDYPTGTWVINPDMSPVAAVPTKYWKLTGDALSEMSQAEKDVVDAADFPAYKQAKNAAIDQRTVELINQGFLYSSKVFSLSSSAQSYWNGLGNLAANGLLTEPDDFPMTVNTLDDTDTHDIVNIANAIGLFAAAAATIKGHLASGTALKTQVRAATTVAEVDAVVDSR